MIGRWDIVGLLLVTAFGVSLAMLWSDAEQLSDEVPDLLGADDGTTQIRLGHEWLGIYSGAAKVGLIHLHKQGRPNGGFKYTVETRLQLKTVGSMELDVSADLSARFELEQFSFAVRAGPADLSGEGQVVGKTIEFALNTGGERVTRTIELANPPVLRTNLGPLLARQDLKVGTRFRFHTFDPMTQQDQPVDVEVIGHETLAILGQAVPVTRIRQTLLGLSLEGWMNARGEMLRQELGLGLVAIRETEEQARWGLVQARGADGVDLVGKTMIDAPGLPESLAKYQALSLEFEGADLSGFKIADATRQQLEGGRITIRKEVLSVGLPLASAAEGAPAESLASSALIQADHPRIKAAAQRAVGDAKDTLTATRRVVAFVHNHLKKELVPGVPSALETLDAQIGDCNEHSTLFAALARAAGVPTRIAVGLVYLNGRFGYHAWNEVRVQGGWLSIDATWNQIAVDVGHIRLLHGGLGQQVALLPIIGQLRLVSARAIP